VIAAFALALAPPALFIALCVRAVRGFTPALAFRALGAGAFALIPIAALQLFAAPLFEPAGAHLGARLFRALILNGLIEEGARAACMAAFMGRKDIRRGAAAAAGAAAGLTTGSLEALMYFAGGMERIALRLVTAAALHAFCALLSALTAVPPASGKRAVAPFAWACALHGVYDFFAGFGGVFRYFSLAALLLAAVECRIWYRKAEEAAAEVRSPSAGGR